MTEEQDNKQATPQYPAEHDLEQENEAVEEEQQIQKKLAAPFSTVAMTENSKKLTIILFVGLIAVLLYFMFGDSQDEELTPEQQSKAIEKKKVEIARTSVSVPKVIDKQLPKTPELEKLTIPQVKPPVIPEPPKEEKTNKSAPKIPELVINKDPKPHLPEVITPQNLGGGGKKNFFSDEAVSEEEAMRLEERRRAGIVVVGGGAGAGLAGVVDGIDNGEAKVSQKDSKVGYLGFGEGAFDGDQIAHTSATQIKATKVGDLSRMILQGKIINGVLESAINTDLPGSLRAIVTRDVYAEQGNHILIKKGSRLIGTYDSSVSNGQTRVSIIWNRLILLPDNIDISISSGGTDNLGRAGVVGKLDTKFFERIASAFLVSYVVPLGIQKIVGNGDEKVTVEEGKDSAGKSTTTTRGSNKSITLREASKQFNEETKAAVKNSFSVKPTITIDQGTQITIQVQKDLIFPTRVIRR